jgi:hypothetical protein
LILCDLALLFDRFGFGIESTAPVDESQMLMLLRLYPVASRYVAVISGDDTSDLAARLGRQLINAILPGECGVDHPIPATIDSSLSIGMPSSATRRASIRTPRKAHASSQSCETLRLLPEIRRLGGKVRRSAIFIFRARRTI